MSTYLLTTVGLVAAAIIASIAATAFRKPQLYQRVGSGTLLAIAFGLILFGAGVVAGANGWISEEDGGWTFVAGLFVVLLFVGLGIATLASHQRQP